MPLIQWFVPVLKTSRCFPSTGSVQVDSAEGAIELVNLALGFSRGHHGGDCNRGEIPETSCPGEQLFENLSQPEKSRSRTP